MISSDTAPPVNATVESRSRNGTNTRSNAFEGHQLQRVVHPQVHAQTDRLAKEAKLEEIEFAARANLLTAEAVQRLSAGGKVTGNNALDRWREMADKGLGLTPATRHSYEGHIKRFLVTTNLVDRPISAASFEHVDKFVNAPDEASVSTRNMRKASLDNFFKVCTAEGLVVRNPATLSKVKLHTLTFEQKEPKVREPFSDLEVDQLSKLESPFWTPACHLSLEYGLRLSDIAKLEWASFDKPGRIIVWTDKHDRRIELPLHPETMLLMDVAPDRHERWVFPEQAAIASDPSDRAKLSVYFSRQLKRLGIHGKSFHSLRHTFATRRAKLGDTIDEIRLKMGHVSTATTGGYVHAEPVECRNIIQLDFVGYERTEPPKVAGYSAASTGSPCGTQFEPKGAPGATG
ncbi:MAG: tyrosine-type recombinase/integrase [Opitutaceae bacterium]